MNELIVMLQQNAQSTIDSMTVAAKDKSKIDLLIKEYKQHDRSQRDTQIGKVQNDKFVGDGAKRRLVRAVRIPLAFQRKIVDTAAAFEFGAPVTLKPSVQNNLSNLIGKLWKVNRMDAKLQLLTKIKKSQTQAALQLRPDRSRSGY